MTHEEILEALNFRYACKKFNPNKKLTKDDMYIVLEAGRLAPSSMGIEPWKFLVIKNEYIKQKIADVSWGGKTQIPTCSHLVIILNRVANDLKADSEYIDYILRVINKMPNDTIQKYKEIIRTNEKVNFKNNESSILDYSIKQTYLAAANMMTIASFLKIDSCPIGGFDEKAVTEILIKNNLIDINHFNVSLMIAFGYRDEDAEPKERQHFQDVVTIID